VGLALIGNLPVAHAGSITTCSIWDRTAALQQARQEVPAGGIITAESCSVVEVGTGNGHYRCTVEFSQPGPNSPAPRAPLQP
jgi:hypothetical protein